MAVLLELGGILSLKERKSAPKALLGGKDVFTLPLTGFCKSLAKPSDTSWLAMGQSCDILLCINRKP